MGGATGEPWSELNADVPRPTASAIKAFYLVELFAAHPHALDKPLPGAEAILKDDRHDAISHFGAQDRDEIRRALLGASVRRVGEVMIGKVAAAKDQRLALVIYNAAANLVTAALGGPDKLTRLIRKRHPGFEKVSVRRYMLRDRKAHGDNEAPAAAFAVLYRRLAERKLGGVDARTVDAIRDVLRQRPDGPSGAHLAKGGSLANDPLTQVRAGVRETPKGPLIYVVMLAQPAPGSAGLKAADKKLEAAADDLEKVLTQAGMAFLK